MALADNLKLQRGKKGWTQTDLSERSGVSRCTIALIESGTTTKPQPKILNALASALKIEVKTLLK